MKHSDINRGVTSNGERCWRTSVRFSGDAFDMTKKIFLANSSNKQALINLRCQANCFTRGLYKQTKKMLSGKKPSINSVDGACNSEAISEVFASKYESLFQGTPTEPLELNSLYRTIKSGVTADKRSDSSITVNDVLDALKDIKLGKHDGKYSLTSDHVVNSSNRFLVIQSPPFITRPVITRYRV